MISRKAAVSSIIAATLAVLGTGIGVANAEPPGPCFGATSVFIVDKGNVGDLLWADVKNCKGPGGEYTIEVSRTVDPICRSIGYGKVKKFQSYSHLGGEIKGVKKC